MRGTESGAYLIPVFYIQYNFIIMMYLLFALTCFVTYHSTSNALIIVEHYNNTSDVICDICTDVHSALLEMRSGSKLIISAGDNYTLSNDDAMTMYGMDSIVIVGGGSNNTVITCDSNAGLAFINMHNITITNLTLKECGAWRNSTTQNSTENYTLKFWCGVYFLDCSDVIMYDVIVTDGPGTGVMMYDTLGTVTIANSHFIRNRVPTDDADEVPGGGGVYIEFSYCKPNTTNFNTCSPSVQANANYTIINSNFTGNNGTTVKQNLTTYVSSIGSSHHQFGRGGAVSVFFKGYSENNTINVIDCHLANNQALWGGGLLIDVLDSARNNKVVVKHVVFFNNSCPIDVKTGGGGIRVHYFPQIESPRNLIVITDSIHDSNSAYYGGGVSVSFKREVGVLTDIDKIIFRNSTWQRNVARVGSAVDLSLRSFVTHMSAGNIVPPVFDNCSFIQNSNAYTRDTVQSVGLGSLNTDEVPFEFYNENYFMENDGTALSVLDALVDFKDNSSAVFYRNKGLRGGAVALLGSTVLRVFPNTTLQFEENMATDKGGAIYFASLGIRDIVILRKCFIQYHDPLISPFEWNATFTFINNKSPNPGHEIYCTTLMPCSGIYISNRFDIAPENTFHWNNTFTYTNDDDDAIATDPASTSVTTDTLSFAPGQLYNLNLSITDDVGISRQTVLFAHSPNDSIVRVANTSTYISTNLIEVTGAQDRQFQLDFQSITTRVLLFSLNATLTKCPPGFYLPETSPVSQSECRCSVYDANEKYNDIPYCDESSSRAFIQSQFWAGYIRNDSVLVVGRCPPGYCLSNGSRQIPLPSEANNTKLDELICSPNNREGVLCGRCKSGYSVYANSKFHECGQCNTKLGHLIVIIAKYIPLIIFLITIILVNINLASGQLNTFVFLSQMLPSLNLYAGGQIPIPEAAKPFVEIYQFCYGVFNLQYFELLDSFPRVCTFSSNSALTVVALDYVTAVCPIIIIFIIWFVMYTSDYCVCKGERNIVGKMAHCVQNVYRKVKPNKDISLSRSFFRGLVTFLVLSYTKFTLVTFTLLKPTYLSGPGGKHYDTVVNLDGTLEYFGHGHLPYAIPAILVLIFIVLLPLVILAMYPRVCTRLGIHVHKMMPFFDSLNGAFKHNCYYFALLYFVYRLIIVAIFSFTPEVQQQYVLQQILSIAILVFHVMKQPYRENKHNIVDFCLLALIPTVLCISSFQLFNVTTSNNINQFAMAVQIILLYLPLIYLASILVYKLYQWRRKYKIDEIAVKGDSQDIINMPARMLNLYAEFEDANDDTTL